MTGIDFSACVNRFQATGVVMTAVRASTATEAEAWAQWAQIEMTRRDAARTPKARAQQARNRAIDAARLRERAGAVRAAGLVTEARYDAMEAMQRQALATITLAEERADSIERAQIAKRNAIRNEAERIAREEAAMTRTDRRAVWSEINQDTSDEIGRIMGAGNGVYGGQA